MKNIIKNAGAGAFALAGTLSILNAQDEVSYNLSPSNITVALTVKETVEGTFERDEVGGAFTLDENKKTPVFENKWSSNFVVVGNEAKPLTESTEVVSKVVTSRYGNRELIEDLVEKETLPGPIAGWSILLVHIAGDDDQYLIARKKGQDDVVLEDLAVIEYTPGNAGSTNELYTTTNRYSGESTTSVKTGRSTSNWESTLNITITTPSDEVEMTLSGREIGSSRNFNYYPDPTDRSVLESIRVPGALRWDNLVGFMDVENSPIVSGSVTVAPSVPVLVK